MSLKGIFLCLVLLPTLVVAQSEVTQRVTAAEAGYRGSVRHVQCQQRSDTPAVRYFLVQEESFNAEGMRTGIVTIDTMGRFYTDCHYAPDGRLLYALCGFPMGYDSLAFRFGADGCPVAYRQVRFTTEGVDDNEGNIFSLECDSLCRLRLFVPPWGDSSVYRYDASGRLVYRALPGSVDTYQYDAQGRLVRQRTGTGYYVDQHFRYDERGDLVETWHTEWEPGSSELPSELPHRCYTYTQYDSHGNWTHASIDVMENGRHYTVSASRLISYY